jgi:Ser-tRNA(Ala) deacylase AlaX
MMPNSNTNVPLNDILAQMDNTEVVDTPVNDTTQTPEPSQVDTNVEESKQDENRQIAQNLMIQAQLLEQDAVAKREEAYKYDPSLKPTETKSKVRVTKAKTDAPKKRGRPKKSEA